MEYKIKETHLTEMVPSENTHHRGKYHYTAGLQFNWIGFDRTRKYVVNCVY